MSPGQPLVK